jgi:hypothetical protein
MSYRILDEPQPGPLQRYVVSPFFPLLATMLAGTWLSVPWTLFNGVALGSASVRTERAVAAMWLLGSALITTVVLALDDNPAVSDLVVRLCLLGLTTWKLGCAYWLHRLQSTSHELFTVYGGVGQPPLRAIAVVVAAMVLKPTLWKLLGTHLWWKVVLL